MIKAMPLKQFVQTLGLLILIITAVSIITLYVYQPFQKHWNPAIYSTIKRARQ